MKSRYGCLAALLVLLIGGFFAYRAFFPQRVGGIAFSQLPPATQKVRRAEAQKLVKQVEEIAKKAKNAGPQPFVITATEEQVNTLLQDRLKTEKFPIHDLRAGLSPDLLTIQGAAAYQGFEVPATLTGKLSAQKGTLQFQVESLQLSGLPAPGKLRDKAEKSIRDALHRAFDHDARARVDEVTLGDHKLTIRGQTD